MMYFKINFVRTSASMTLWSMQYVREKGGRGSEKKWKKRRRWKDQEEEDEEEKDEDEVGKENVNCEECGISDNTKSRRKRREKSAGRLIHTQKTRARTRVRTHARVCLTFPVVTLFSSLSLSYPLCQPLVLTSSSQ